MAIAIKITTLPATCKKPTRSKASAFGQKSVIYSKSQFDVNSVKSVDLQCALVYAHSLGWLDYNNWTYEQPFLIGGQLDQSNSVFVFQHIKQG